MHCPFKHVALVLATVALASTLSAQLVLTKGVSASASSNTTLSTTLESNNWNCVGVTAWTTSNWDVRMGSTWSNQGTGLCDFVVANLELGSASNAGEVVQSSGAGGAWVQHANRTNLIAGGSTVNYSWTQTDVVRIWSIYTPTPGTRNVTVSGTGTTGDHYWFLFNPGSGAAWRPRSAATYGYFSVSSNPVAINFNVAGTWCLVVCQDRGVGNTPTISLTVGSVGGVPPTALSQGSPTTVSSTPTQFSISPQQGWWNAVAVSSPNDWNISMAGATSSAGGGTCDFVLANGNAGTITTSAGEVTRFSGAASATLEHAAGPESLLVPGSGSLASFAGGHVVRTAELYVSTVGTYTVTVYGSTSSDFKWYIFAPTASSAWTSRSNATHGPLPVGTSQSVNFNQNGYWLLVVVLDNGASQSSTISATITTATQTPGQPTLVSPQNGHQTSSTSITLSWQAPATGTPPLTYDLVVGYDPSMTSIFTSASGVTGTSRTISGFTPGTTYFWKVRAYNGEFGPWSQTWNFEVAATPSTLILQRIAPAEMHYHDVSSLLEASFDGILSGGDEYQEVEWTLDNQYQVVGSESKQLEGRTGQLRFSWSSTEAQVNRRGELDLTIGRGSMSMNQAAYVKTKAAQHYGTYTVQMRCSSCSNDEGVINAITLYNDNGQEISVEVFGNKPELYFGVWHPNQQPFHKTIVHVRPADDELRWYYNQDVTGSNFTPQLIPNLSTSLGHFTNNHTSDFVEYQLVWSAQSVELLVDRQTICTISSTVVTADCDLYIKLGNAFWARGSMGSLGYTTDPHTSTIGHISVTQASTVWTDDFNGFDQQRWQRSLGCLQPGRTHTLTAGVKTVQGKHELISWYITTGGGSSSAPQEGASCTATVRTSGCVKFVLALALVCMLLAFKCVGAKLPLQWTSNTHQ